jgi:hypothetical protein
MLETFGWFAVSGFGAGLGWHGASILLDFILGVFDDDE